MIRESKVAVVCIQIGPWPPSIELFMKSCAWNPSIDWLVFSDHALPVEAPRNVLRIPATLEGLRKRFKERLGRAIALDLPYKLCDYRPMYGEIFAEELEGYDFWGQCDFDVVFGRIRELLPAKVLGEFDKILVRGNFALYRNTAEMNAMYRQVVPGVDWRKVVSTNKSRNFDEWPGIYKILLAKGVRIYNEPVIADIENRYYDLRLTHAKGYVPQMITSDLATGKLMVDRWMPGRGLVSAEKLLIHLQKRDFRPVLSSPAKLGLIAYGPKGIHEIESSLRGNKSLSLALNPRSYVSDGVVLIWRARRRFRNLGRDLGRLLQAAPIR